jgi:hypothetical protein
MRASFRRRDIEYSILVVPRTLAAECAVTVTEKGHLSRDKVSKPGKVLHPVCTNTTKKTMKSMSIMTMQMWQYQMRKEHVG